MKSEYRVKTMCTKSDEQQTQGYEEPDLTELHFELEIDLTHALTV